VVTAIGGSFLLNPFQIKTQGQLFLDGQQKVKILPGSKGANAVAFEQVAA
jgi:hypothetical protein